MSSPLDNWNPPTLAQPDYYDTVKYVYKHIEFHISEDEAYTILDAFIGKWDASAGESLRDDELKTHVVNALKENFQVLMPTPKISRVVELILSYLYETGHYFQQELKTAPVPKGKEGKG